MGLGLGVVDLVSRLNSLVKTSYDIAVEKGILDTISLTDEYGVKGTFFVNISGEEEVEDDIGHFGNNGGLSLRLHGLVK